MSQKNDFKVYTTDGETINNRGISLPLFEETFISNSPKNYVADEPLSSAVNVAIALGMPLLVTGEPGTGKTQLAYSIAYQLNQKNLREPLVFHTKSSSTAKDLFYQYDALGHFHDARIPNKGLDVADYISLEAMGLAILLSLSPTDQRRKEVNKHIPEGFRDVGPVRPVVLIDEIDKAPRDVPNDILNEIEDMAFTIRETRRPPYKADRKYSPILVFTSNSEKDLPAAFLRRCVFYHIDFPDTKRLKEIVIGRLSLSEDYKREKLDEAIERFQRIRELVLRKKPATAELLAWIQILDKLGLSITKLNPKEAETLAVTYSILIKNKEDRELVKTLTSQQR